MSGAERRSFGRVETCTRGWIILPDRPPLQCIVKDLSLQGAQLELKIPPWLPRAFKLEIESTKLKAYCEVRHTSAGSVGVRFVSGMPSQPPAFSRSPERPGLATSPRAGLPPPARSGSERRYFGRSPTSLAAWINVPARPRLACTVTNLSIGGAFLELETPPWLPLNFQLMIQSTGFISMCEIRHKTDKGVGVRFLAAVEQAVIDRRKVSETRSLDDKGASDGRAKAEAPSGIGQSRP